MAPTLLKRGTKKNYRVFFLVKTGLWELNLTYKEFRCLTMSYRVAGVVEWLFDAESGLSVPVETGVGAQPLPAVGTLIAPVGRVHVQFVTNQIGFTNES